MKQTFYKIIAIASVMLGALGPQVASGAVQAVSQQAIPQHTNSSYSLIVSDTSQSQTNLQIKFQTDDNCLVSMDEARLDLMLWTGCNSLTIASPQQRSLPLVTVVGQPEHLQSVIAQNPISIGSQLAFSSGPGREGSILPPPGLSMKTISTEISGNAIPTKLNTGVQLLSNQVNNLRTIILRC